MAILGLPMAALFVLPNPILADVVDEDETRTGLRREGIYFAAAGTLNKLGFALSTVIFGLLLQSFGFSTAQPLGVRLVGPVAGLGMLLGLLIFVRGYRLPDRITAPAVSGARSSPAQGADGSPVYSGAEMSVRPAPQSTPPQQGDGLPGDTPEARGERALDERASARRGWLWIALACLISVPWLVVRFFTDFHALSPTVVALLTGVAILGAAFILSWAAEAFQMDVSQALALALLSLIAVLPEYAVDVVFAWRAASDPTQAPYAVANMTGANRLLIGIGWSFVVILAWWRSRRVAAGRMRGAARPAGGRRRREAGTGAGPGDRGPQPGHPLLLLHSPQGRDRAAGHGDPGVSLRGLRLGHLPRPGRAPGAGGPGGDDRPAGPHRAPAPDLRHVRSGRRS